MNVATDGAWEGSYSGNTIDGSDVWDALINNHPSPHEEIVFYVSDDSAAIQHNMIKYVFGFAPDDVNAPLYEWDKDLDPKSSRSICSVTSSDEVSGDNTSRDIVHKKNKFQDNMRQRSILYEAFVFFSKLFIFFGLLGVIAFLAKRMVDWRVDSVNNMKNTCTISSMEEQLPFVAGVESTATYV